MVVTMTLRIAAVTVMGVIDAWQESNLLGRCPTHPPESNLTQLAGCTRFSRNGYRRELYVSNSVSQFSA
jgi:hypothetical protein